MPLYDVTVYVRVWADDESQAYRYIQSACDSARMQEVVYIDAEVTATEKDDEQ